MESLNSHIHDHHTRLKLFAKCTIQKLPHLLASDTMHNFDTNESPDSWYNYNGNLIQGIDTIIQQFFQILLVRTEYLPISSTLITHLSTKNGGLGIINASLQAIPDFLLTMMFSKRRAYQGFNMNKDLQPIKLHSSIQDLYSISTNPNSPTLQRYLHLLPTIAKLSCSDKCPTDEIISHFENNTSLHSARSRIKQHRDNIINGQIYSTIYTERAEDLHLLPSLLSPQTSYPLIDVNRSNANNRLPNWSFDIAIKRKLRLPITNREIKCKCRATHDIYGDHTFHCRHISKKQAHNIIRDGWASALKPH